MPVMLIPIFFRREKEKSLMMYISANNRRTFIYDYKCLSIYPFSFVPEDGALNFVPRNDFW